MLRPGILSGNPVAHRKYLSGLIIQTLERARMQPFILLLVGKRPEGPDCRKQRAELQFAKQAAYFVGIQTPAFQFFRTELHRSVGGDGCQFFGEKNIEIPQEGFTKNIFCAGKSTTLAFLRNVLDEVCSLFPSPYVHLGGDEAPKENWDNCPDCQQQIRRNGLQNSHELQMWLSSEMAKYLKEKGRMVVFWGDLIYKDTYPLPDGTVIQWWNYRGHKDLAVRNALKHGHQVICSPNYYTYLNFPIIPWEGYQENRTFDFRDVCLNNPADKMLARSDSSVLGMTCALWMDYGVTEDMIDCRLFPRIIALAEQMWYQGERKDWKMFYESILRKKEWFESAGYSFGIGLRSEY